MNHKCMSKKVITLVIVATMLNSGIAVHAADKDNVKKDEAVYVTLDPNGVIKEKIVSDWIHSKDTNSKIEDKSSLIQIKNIKGNEKPEISGENLTWKSDKNDIYYQGKTNKKLPLDFNIEYELDGRKIFAKDLAGKSGVVKIKIKFKNLDSHTIKVKGKDKNVYTPFTVAGVVNLPTDKFKNIKINDGEIISDGKNQMAAFAALPGLKDSLNISKDLIDLDLKDEIEITADAENFELTPIMITATPKLPEMDKIEKSDKIDELKDGIKELKDNSLKLVEANQKLDSGSKEINSKMGELASGISLFNTQALNPMKSGSSSLASGIMQYTAGVGTAKNGAATLSAGLKAAGPGANQLGQGFLKASSGASQYTQGAGGYSKGANTFSEKSKEFADGTGALSSKTGQLVGGTSKLKEGTSQLNSKAKKITDTSAKISNGLNQIVNNTEKLAGGSQQVSQGLGQSIDSLRKLEVAKEQESEGMQQTINTIENFQQLINPLKNIAGAESIFGKLNGGFEQLKQKTVEGKQSSDTILGKLQELEGGLNKIKQGADVVSGGINELQQGQKQLQSGANKFAEETKILPQKVAEIDAGAGKLNEGASQLKPGLKKLKEGSQGLSKGAKDLGGASTKLGAGSKALGSKTPQLVEGSKQFNSKTKQAVVGSKQISDGLTQLDGKSPELRGGASKLSKGATEAYNKYSIINNGAQKMSSATGTLSKGASDTSEGMKKFNDEGINKLDDKVSDGVTDVEEVMDTKDEIVNLSKDYETFTGVGNDMKGDVKFVLKTDEIKAPKVEDKNKNDSKNQEEEKEEGGFVNWIKNIFN